jgi:hypothetical protein
MNSDPTRLAMMLMVVVALASIGTTATAFAQPSDNQGIERADENVHQHAPQADIVFHEGLCQAGIETEALVGLFPGGCEQFREEGHVPGESGDVRQDN